MDPDVETSAKLAEAPLNGESKPTNSAKQQPESDANDRLQPTDLGNARRLVIEHGDDLRYCAQLGFLTYDNKRWARDETGGVMRRAKATARAILAEAAGLEDDRAGKALAQHALRSQAAPRLRDMVELAKSELPIATTIDRFDTDPWSFNVANGTLDLRSQELRPHRREDFITKLAPINYDPDATCPAWEAFLSQIMDGNAELVTFLQKAVGYSLTGITTEQCFFMLYGSGSNGKSTLLHIILLLLAEYAKTTRTETLLARRQDHIPNDIARLHGARLVAAVESDMERRLAEALIKQLTGGDVISARFLKREFFEFRPQFKVWMAVNHKPIVKGVDHAIWRRIRLLPFTKTIPDDAQDKNLADKLEAELPGVLAWAVRGCRLWVQEGLAPPRAVLAATQGYREEMDVLGDFIRELCIESPKVTEAVSELFKEYTAWCDESEERKVSKKAFGTALKERGFAACRVKGGRGYRGIRLRLLSDEQVEAMEADTAQLSNDSESEAARAALVENAEPLEVSLED